MRKIIDSVVKQRLDELSQEEINEVIELFCDTNNISKSDVQELNVKSNMNYIQVNKKALNVEIFDVLKNIKTDFFNMNRREGDWTLVMPTGPIIVKDDNAYDILYLLLSNQQGNELYREFIKQAVINLMQQIANSGGLYMPLYPQDKNSVVINQIFHEFNKFLDDVGYIEYKEQYEVQVWNE